MTFVTGPFERAARTHARIHGLPDIPLVVVPSDYLDSSDELIARTVAPIVDDLLAALFDLPGGRDRS